VVQKRQSVSDLFVPGPLLFSGRANKKPRSHVHSGRGFEMLFFNAALGFLYQSGLDRFDAYPHALNLPGGQAYFNALNVGTEFACRGFSDMRSDTAAFLGLSLAVNSTACGGAFTGNCANSSHD